MNNENYACISELPFNEVSPKKVMLTLLLEHTHEGFTTYIETEDGRLWHVREYSDTAVVIPLKGIICHGNPTAKSCGERMMFALADTNNVYTCGIDSWNEYKKKFNVIV